MNSECLRGFDLSVSLRAHHASEKIPRIHRRQSVQMSHFVFSPALIRKALASKSSSHRGQDARGGRGEGNLPAIGTTTLPETGCTGSPTRLHHGALRTTTRKEFQQAKSLIRPYPRTFWPPYAQIRTIRPCVRLTR